MKKKPPILYLNYTSILTQGILLSQVVIPLKKLASEGYQITLVSGERAEDLRKRKQREALHRDLEDAGVELVFFKKTLPPYLRVEMQKIGSSPLRALCFFYDQVRFFFLTGWLLLTRHCRILHARSYVPAIIGLFYQSVLGIYLIIQKSYAANVQNISSNLKIISYSAITALGLFLLIKAIVELKRKKQTPSDSLKNKNLLPLALAVGLVPCPGAVLILLFAISMEIIKVGIILTIFYSLGMGVTISTVGAITILTKKGALGAIHANERTQNIIHYGLEFFGAILIFVIGVLLLWSRLG